jgi:hypothetical protein
MLRVKNSILLKQISTGFPALHYLEEIERINGNTEKK